MNYYIYITTNLINDKKYIGKHFGELDDSYLGSGMLLQRAIEKYGAKNFKKEILQICDSFNVDECEIFWISYFDAANNKNFYNLTDGGTGGNTLENLSEADLQERKQKFKNYLDSLDEQEKIRINKLRSENMKRILSDPHVKKKRLSKMKETVSNKSEEWKRERYKNQSGKNHYAARKVRTPLGEFDMATIAAQFHNVSVQTVLNRCKNENFEGWEYIIV